jgi:hypothetical protein
VVHDRRPEQGAADRDAAQRDGEPAPVRAGPIQPIDSCAPAKPPISRLAMNNLLGNDR